MCRTIDDEIIDIIFCYLIRSTDAEVMHKTNMCTLIIIPMRLFYFAEMKILFKKEIDFY